MMSVIQEILMESVRCGQLYSLLYYFILVTMCFEGTTKAVIVVMAYKYTYKYCRLYEWGLNGSIWNFQSDGRPSALFPHEVYVLLGVQHDLWSKMKSFTNHSPRSIQ